MVHLLYWKSPTGATAAFLTNPIDTVTARLMTQGHGSLVETNSNTASTLPSLKYSTSVIECGKTIVREEGTEQSNIEIST